MNVITIQKPLPHCPIPYGHALYEGYVPAEDTDIRKKWARAYADDYDRVQQADWLEPGGFK